MRLRRSLLDEAHGKIAADVHLPHVYVPDTDALYAQAVRTGAISVIPPQSASLQLPRRHPQRPLTATRGF